MLEQKKKWLNNLQFMCVLFVICFALFITYYGQEVRRYNTTILAFNYSHGFISRGLLGSAYLWLNEVLPYDILNYESVVNLTLIATTVVLVTFFILILLILRKVQSVHLTSVQYIILYFVMFFVPMYYSFRNMGRPDIYMLFLTFIGLICIVTDKCEWLIIPLSILCVMIHQGYVFMFYSIFMYLLAYKALENTGKKRKKYVAFLILSFLAVAGLFLYFNFFSHLESMEVYNEIYALAAKLGQNGEVYETLLTHEILGLDPWEQEWPDHIYNFIELPIFCLFMLPYIILGIRFFKNLITAAETKLDKFKYILIPVCSVTIVPCYILKIDYGRWIFAGVAYFSLVLLTLCGLGDKLVAQKLHEIIEEVQAKCSYASLLLLFIGTMIPLHDININTVMNSISEWLDKYFLHIINPIM